MWGKEILFEKRDNTNKQNACAVTIAFSFLKSMHPHSAKSDKFTRNDCANLLHHSLNKCTIILPASKHGLNTDQFKFWSESSNQSSLLHFREIRTHAVQIETVANPTDNGRRACTESMASHVLCDGEFEPSCSEGHPNENNERRRKKVRP